MGYGADDIGAARVAIDAQGVVHLKGGIKQVAGTTPVAFTLANAYRPTRAVYIPVDLQNAHYGRLFIARNGTVTVQGTDGNNASARGFTSLEGVSYPK